MNKEVRGGGPCAHAHESVYIFHLFILICYACAPRQMQMVRKWAWKEYISRLFQPFSYATVHTDFCPAPTERINISAKKMALVSGKF